METSSRASFKKLAPSVLNTTSPVPSMLTHSIGKCTSTSGCPGTRRWWTNRSRPSDTRLMSNPGFGRPLRIRSSSRLCAISPGGGNRTHTRVTPQRIFVPASAFAAPPLPAGSWSGLCLHPGRVLPVESLHTPSRFRGLLGSALPHSTGGAGGSPNLGSSTSDVAVGALKLTVQVRSVCRSATPGTSPP